MQRKTIHNAEIIRGCIGEHYIMRRLKVGAALDTNNKEINNGCNGRHYIMKSLIVGAAKDTT